MSLADVAARMIARSGESMTLARSGETSIVLKGKRIGGTLEALGNTGQQRFRVKIGTAELLASSWATKVPTASGDTLTVAGRVCAVLDVKPISDATTVPLYELEVAG